MKCVEWRDRRNGEMYFLSAAFSENGWGFEERSSFDVQYVPIPSTRDLIRRAELETLLSHPRWGPYCRAGLETVHESVAATEEAVRRDGARALEPARIGCKPIRAIDLTAEWDAVRSLRRRLGRRDFVVFGEEGLRNNERNLSREKRPVILLDAVDGTDLLARGLSNWCSAMAIFDPLESRMIATFVGRPGETVFYAIGSKTGGCLFNGSSFREFSLAGPSDITSISEGSLAFYGQKVANFLAVSGLAGFTGYLRKLHRLSANVGRPLDTRIYNLAGNPAFVKLVDGLCRIDAVFEVQGQALHDMIPGAYIAQQSGCFVCDLNGESLDLTALLARSPESRVRYVAASTQALALDLCRQFAGSEQVDSGSAIPVEALPYAV
jgi:fructose-1,6-bisphosphatase/inositol monophosphatase family enzyme